MHGILEHRRAHWEPPPLVLASREVSIESSTVYLVGRRWMLRGAAIRELVWNFVIFDCLRRSPLERGSCQTVSEVLCNVPTPSLTSSSPNGESGADVPIPSHRSCSTTTMPSSPGCLRSSDLFVCPTDTHTIVRIPGIPRTIHHSSSISGSSFLLCSMAPVRSSSETTTRWARIAPLDLPRLPRDTSAAQQSSTYRHCHHPMYPTHASGSARCVGLQENVQS